MIKKVENLTPEQLEAVRKTVGEAFVSNELFRNWGTEEQRREDVLRYMAIYVDYVYRAGELYANEERTAFIGLEDSARAPLFGRVKMILRMLFKLKRQRIASLLHFARQVEKSNEKYAKKRHIDALMVVVDAAHRGQGLASELVAFAKDFAARKGVPLLFDTDMRSYAEMYKHLGCELYNTVTADNGVTRYSLCRLPAASEHPERTTL